MKQPADAAVAPARVHRWKPTAAALFVGTGLWGPRLTAACAQTTPPVPAVAPAKKPAFKPGRRPSPKPDESVRFFRDGAVPRLKIQIPEAELNRLRQQNRAYVRCTVVENDKTTYEHVGIKLQGRGTFQGVDGRPSLTLNFDKFKDKQEFHDLDKLHLRNSVQDPSYLSELIANELFLAAGVPAARTTHARVWLNGRDLGFYVLKEGFGQDLLKRNGLDPKGNLYEAGYVQDLDGTPELDSGDGATDGSDVKAVVAACREGDPRKRWQRVEQLVDIDRFVTFAAMELMTGHRDGYCQNRNNYRFYFDPKTGKLQFFPHGMDQMFDEPNFGILKVPNTMVAQAILSNPEWRARFRDRVSALLKLIAPPDRLVKRMDELHQRLRPILAELGAERANGFDDHVKALRDRLAARAKNLTQQVAVVEPRPTRSLPPVLAPTNPPAPQKAVVDTGPLRFSPAGVAQITRWSPRLETRYPAPHQGGSSPPSGQRTGEERTRMSKPACRC